VTRSERARALAIPLLVVLCALFHAYRTVSVGQSSWGAGQPLGMFGHLDSHGSRFVRARAGGCEIAIPPELAVLERHARVVPSELRALADALAPIAARECPSERTLEVDLRAVDLPDRTALTLVSRSLAVEHRELAR
jgi:hypothetical protein